MALEDPAQGHGGESRLHLEGVRHEVQLGVGLRSLGAQRRDAGVEGSLMEHDGCVQRRRTRPQHVERRIGGRPPGHGVRAQDPGDGSGVESTFQLGGGASWILLGQHRDRAEPAGRGGTEVDEPIVHGAA